MTNEELDSVMAKAKEQLVVSRFFRKNSLFQHQI